MHNIARFLVRLHPRAWRERYGDEVLALVEESGGGWRQTIDLLGSSVDQWSGTALPHALAWLLFPTAVGLVGIAVEIGLVNVLRQAIGEAPASVIGIREWLLWMPMAVSTYFLLRWQVAVIRRETRLQREGMSRERPTSRESLDRATERLRAAADARHLARLEPLFGSGELACYAALIVLLGVLTQWVGPTYLWAALFRYSPLVQVAFPRSRWLQDPTLLPVR